MRFSLSAAPRPGRAERRLPGEEGIWVFVVGDLLVFALFFGVIVSVSAEQDALFQASQAQLSQGAGTLNTLLLLTSSLFVALGMGRARGYSAGRADPWFAAALLCGMGFVAIKVFEYAGKLGAGVTPATNDFWMYYFVFTGIHLLHVLIGLGVLSFLIRRVRRRALSAHDVSLLESGASFWHLVDLLWIVLFALFYLMA